MPEIDEIRELLNLEPLPGEGGFYRVTFTSDICVPAEALPARFPGPRAGGSAIYYLVTPAGFSAMHRLRSHETFHFYMGDPLEMLQLHPDGSGELQRLGIDLQAGQRPQIQVPSGVWQGTRLLTGGRYALIGTTMSPGFEWDDFELGERGKLVARYPDHRAMIRELTRSRR